MRYLERYHGIDLSLDPFPYNGHTSTLDSLLDGGAGGDPGGAYRRRPGRSEYPVERGAARADRQDARGIRGDRCRAGWDLSRLRGWRGAAARMEASPLRDGRQFAAGIEAAFRGMWERWCQGCP